MSNPILTPQLLLQAYAAGIFPMAESADSDELLWFDPPVRAILPLDGTFHTPRRLLRTLRQRPYRVTLNAAFPDVMRGCAEPRPGREKTWINDAILEIYTELHRRNHAHSIEVWDGANLIGGLYGVSLGSAFFGESMFSRQTDTSKIALAHLIALLRLYRFTVLDTQFMTDHLARFGAHEIMREDYQRRVALAARQQIEAFPPQAELIYLPSDTLSLQPVTQIS